MTGGPAKKTKGAESQIGSHLKLGQLREALETGLQAYGEELYRFAATLLRDDADTDDAFARACESMWKGLSRFRGESSFRVWAYTVTRHACYSQLKERKRRPTNIEPWLQTLEQKVRTETRPYLQTTIKGRIEKLRESLDEEAQTLLTLRIDRGMEWLEIAQVMAEPGSEHDRAALTRASATLRKRFERTKVQLRELARAEGLLGDDEL